MDFQIWYPSSRVLAEQRLGPCSCLHNSVYHPASIVCISECWDSFCTHAIPLEPLGLICNPLDLLRFTVSCSPPVQSRGPRPVFNLVDTISYCYESSLIRSPEFLVAATETDENPFMRESEELRRNINLGCI